MEKKKVLIIVIVVGVLFIMKSRGSTAGTAGNGQVKNTVASDNFTPSDAGFTVHFPGKPDHSVQFLAGFDKNVVTPYQQDDYLYGDGPSVAFVATSVHYPSFVDVSSPEKVMRAALASSSATISGKVSTSTVGDFGSYHTLEYQLYSETANINVRGKYIFASSSLYGVAVLYRGDAPTTTEVFFKSFKLK